MNRTFNDIDRSLTETKSKMKTDLERSLRGLNFGKLYLKNGDFETALKYVKAYLNVRPHSSEGHKLLAQIYEEIGEDETALLNYRKALDLKKNSNESFLASIPPPITTPSMSEINNKMENNSKVYEESTPVRKAKTPETTLDSRTHSCGICSNQSVLNKILKQNDYLMETNKKILEILKQNDLNVIVIQNQLVSLTQELNGLKESQNQLKDSLYDYIAQDEHEGFEDYILDDKENESIDPNSLLDISNSQSNQWHSSGIQLMPAIDSNKPLSELFKPAADSWNCEACYVQNSGSDIICAACTTPKAGATVEISTEPLKTNFSFGITEPSQPPQSSQPFSFKTSNVSTGFNFGSIEPKTTESNTIFSNTNFKFGNSSFVPTLGSTTSPQFNFQPNKPNETKSPQNIFGINSNLVETPKINSFEFGLSRTFDFQFPKFDKPDHSPTNPLVIEEKIPNEKKEENTSLNESIVEPSNADNIYFQPVVPLPPKIVVKTGEENEIVVHSCRARLFRFIDGEWKERGVGEIKILKCCDSNRIRLLMRRDTIFKVCLNQSITQDLKLDVKEDKKSITWSAVDYSEETASPHLFLLRLKNAEIAQLFIDAIERAKTELITEDNCKTSLQSVSKEITSKPETKSSEKSNKSSKDDDIEIIYQKMPESEEILKKVRELQLPLNFYDYENMEPCPGCRGCIDDDIPILSNSTQNVDKVIKETADSTQESLFSSLIAATNITQTDWKKNTEHKLWFTNTPTPIFSSHRSPSQDEDSVEPNPDIYFKPLIPLPDLVEVKTGEEDESPVFCHRSKLYRYDSQTKEWKERGTGEFKILKHNSKNRFRMVLRRDQILKIACNHYITSDMNLNPMSTSETSVCWYAVDYTEGNPIEEQFAIKFKNKDILQEFKKTFNECKEKLGENLNDSYNEENNDFNGNTETFPKN